MLLNVKCYCNQCSVKIHTHTQPFNSRCSGTTRVGRYQKKRSPTHTHPGHWTSFINFLHLLHSIASSVLVYVLDSALWQPLSRSSLVFLLVLDPVRHSPCISSPSHHLFAAYAHTNAACSAAKPMLCHLYLVSLSQLLILCALLIIITVQTNNNLLDRFAICILVSKLLRTSCRPRTCRTVSSWLRSFVISAILTATMKTSFR